VRSGNFFFCRELRSIPKHLPLRKTPLGAELGSFWSVGSLTATVLSPLTVCCCARRERGVALQLVGEVLREPERARRPRQRLLLAITDLAVAPRALQERSVGLTYRKGDVLVIERPRRATASLGENSRRRETSSRSMCDAAC